MASHGERPDDHEAAPGRFGYLSSLGLDDSFDDGFDDALDGTLDARGPGEGAGTWRGDRPAPQAGPPGGEPRQPETDDPTAAWALPQVEGPAEGVGDPDTLAPGLPARGGSQMEELPTEDEAALGTAHHRPDALAHDHPDALAHDHPDAQAYPQAEARVGVPFTEALADQQFDQQAFDQQAFDQRLEEDTDGREGTGLQAGDPWPVPLPSQASDHEPRPAEQTRYRVQEDGPRSGEQLNADMLTADTVLRARAPRPTRGWRRTLYTASGGRVNLGLSPAERREAELIDRARTPLSGCHRLAVISLKGGVGKTTTTAALGAMFASLRGDRVVAVDANPDRGTLGERVPRETTATVRDLLDARESLTRYADVRRFTSQSATRLEVIASDVDPGVSQAFSEADYRDTVSILERFYNLLLTDCGTGLLHSAMQGILGLADSLVIVSSASLDGARSAAATLDWLEAHGFADVVRQAVTVISTVRPGGGSVDVDRLEDHFIRRCRSVVPIPYDPHLEAGGVLDLDELAPATREAYYELTAEVGEGFALSSQQTAAP